MKRDLTALSSEERDVVVVGGGIFGACLAWEAASRGLTVSLLEQGDFSHATSANSFRMVHGGIRYLQHGDLHRVRESCEERRTLLRIAPHLVSPLPILIPTYRRYAQGKTLLMAALALYDTITADRNWGIRDVAHRIPRGRILSRQECLDICPYLNPQGVTGGALFHDGQMYNPPRLTLAFLHSAVERGAHVANYTRAIGFLRSAGRIVGVRALDLLGGDVIEVRGRITLNAAGPWAEQLLENVPEARLVPSPVFSRDVCFVLTRQLAGSCALAVQGATRDPDALLSRGARHLFIVPWRRYTLVGVWHAVHRGKPEDFTVTPEETGSFLQEVNGACPALRLGINDIALWNAGLVLFGHNKPGARDLSYGKRSLIVDHRRSHGLDGLMTIVGVRYSTARAVASRVIDRLFNRLGRPTSASLTSHTPICGGDFETFDSLNSEAASRSPVPLPPQVLTALLHNYGSAYRKVLQIGRENPNGFSTLGDSTVLSAEIVHAARQEMACKLGDVVFRRTDLGTGERPDEPSLQLCARLLGAELGWSPERERKELEEVRATYARLESARDPQ